MGRNRIWRIVSLAGRDADHLSTLQELREALGIAADAAPLVNRYSAEPAARSCPTGVLNVNSVAAAVAHCIPENAIVCDEAITLSHTFGQIAAHAAPHDLIQLTGGAIGAGVPLATGAAIACPDRPVIALQADGSAMYTLQGLWTQAREGLNIVTVLLANRRYEILYGELANVGGSSPGANARAMFDLDRPAPDWCSLARGFGVEAIRVETAEALVAAIKRGLATPGPVLVEAVYHQGTDS